MDGWDLLQNYDTEESEEDDDGHAPENYLGFSARRQVEPRQSNEKTKKYRMALKTVLEALIEEKEGVYVGKGGRGKPVLGCAG